MIVLHASPNVRSSGRELQLPAMSLLTSKMSGQQFLLRILKVIIQLRDAARQALKKVTARNIGMRNEKKIMEEVSFHLLQTSL